MKLRKKATAARRVRRTHSAEFKARVALAALRDDKTLAQLCQEFDLHANQIAEWKRQLIERAAHAFAAQFDATPPDTGPTRRNHAIIVGFAGKTPTAI